MFHVLGTDLRGSLLEKHSFFIDYNRVLFLKKRPCSLGFAAWLVQESVPKN